jgi:hypothetical protein
MKLRTSSTALLLAAVTTAVTAATATAASAAPNALPPGVIQAHGPGVFPHSVDYNPRSKQFVVGSLKHSTISTVTLDGTVHTIVDDPRLVSVQAVRLDLARNQMLATDADYGLADRSTKAGTFHVAAVASYPITGGSRQWYVDLAALAGDGKQHLISDVTVAPDGTAYAVDELSPTVFRIDSHGRASVFLRSNLLAGIVTIPNFLSGVGQTAVTWMPGNLLIISMADGRLVRVPIHHRDRASLVRLDTPLTALVAGLHPLPGGSIVAISSGLLTGKAAVVARVRPDHRWHAATVTITDTVPDPVSSGISAGPDGSTYALSGRLAALLMGKPNEGFVLTPVTVR